MSQLLSNSSTVARITRHWLGGICVLRCMNAMGNVLSGADIPLLVIESVFLRLLRNRQIILTKINHNTEAQSSNRIYNRTHCHNMQ